MLTIGIDASLTGTGYCLIYNKDIIHTETIDTKKLNRMARLFFIENTLEKLIRDACLIAMLDLICLEGYSFASRGNAVYQIGELGGFIRRLFAVNHWDYLEIAPPTLKKFVTGKGSSKKEEMIAHVYKRWNIMPENNNEADAIGLAMLGQHIVNEDEVGLTVNQRNALIKPIEGWHMLSDNDV